MSTRSRIGIQNEDGTVSSIYCHWNGHPSYNGKILKEYYSNREKLQQLIDLGDISYLAEEVSTEDEHTFDKPKKGITVAYHRDRGEALQKAKIDESLSSFRGEDYGYVYTLDDEWMVVEN